MKVAVFGASGKLGRRLVSWLLDNGHHVRALMHRTPMAGEVETVRGSVADPAACRKVVDDADVVVHLATAKEDPDTFFDVSIRGTFEVLEACRANPNLKQLILVSGDAAQGIWFFEHPEPINESTKLQAYPGFYAFSKVIEETMARQYEGQYGLPVTILRSSWVFDEDDLIRHFSLLENINPAEPGHGFGDVPEEVLERIRRGEDAIPLFLDASGHPLRRHIIHIDDVVHAFSRMLGNQAAIGRDYNIAGPSAFDYRTGAATVSEKTGLPFVELSCPDYHSFEIDCRRARNELGYQPRMTFERMLESALEARRGKRLF